MAESAFDFPMEDGFNSASIPPHTEDDIDMTWHDTPSSPFVSHVEHDNQENIAPAANDEAARTPVKRLMSLEGDMPPQSAFRVRSPEKNFGLREQGAPATKVSPEKSPAKELFDTYEDKIEDEASEIIDSIGVGSAATSRAASPVKMSVDGPELLDAFDETSFFKNYDRGSPKHASPEQHISDERPESAMSNRSRRDYSPSKSSRAPSVEATPRRVSVSTRPNPFGDRLSPAKRPSSTYITSDIASDLELRENEGLTVAVKYMEETRETCETHSSETHSMREEMSSLYRVESFGSDGQAEFEDRGSDNGMEDADRSPHDHDDLTLDDTCFSNFSEMPNLDMTKFAFLKTKSPTKNLSMDQATPRARTQMTPSTVRRTDRTPSPTPTPRQPRRETAGDTTNLLLDFTAQIEAFSSYSSQGANGGRRSPTKSSTQPNLLSHIQGQRSPGKRASQVPATPTHSRQVFNLLDFELPPPPTPRSVPTVTIRELESLKSTFQSQISSLSASLSGKEAEVESLVKAVSDAERRVGSAQEQLRDERSAREHAEAQMVDWKNKGTEVEKLLENVQAELTRNDAERDSLLAKLQEAEKRAEDAEQRSAQLEMRAMEAESKNVDMTTFINPDEDEDNKKIFSEAECMTAIAERVNEVAHDLHTAYKAKHEKKIKALKENYQKKADERTKDLRTQIIRLERQVADAKKDRDDTFSKVLPEMQNAGPCTKCTAEQAKTSELAQQLDTQNSTVENLKAKLAGLQSELSSLRKSHDNLVQDLESERVEKGELVAAAEQMLALCGEKMGEMQQEEMRKSQIGRAPPSASREQNPPTMRTTGFLAGGPAPARPGSSMAGGRPGSAMGERLGAMGGGADKSGTSASGIAKPSGLRAPGGFGLKNPTAPGLSRAGSGKSRLLSNIERMGGRGQQE